MSDAQAETTLCADEVPCAPLRVGSGLPSRLVNAKALIREAFRLEWLTIGWMSIEAVVAIGSGLMAGSLVLTAFGVDSLIELTSAGVLIWRLTVELRRGQAFSENAERLASRIAGGLLFALAAYVTVSEAAWISGHKPARRSPGPASSWPWPPFRPCATLLIGRLWLPKSSAVVRCERMQWRP